MKTTEFMARVSLRERIKQDLFLLDGGDGNRVDCWKTFFQAVVINFAIWSIVLVVAPWFFLITSRPLLAMD